MESDADPSLTRDREVDPTRVRDQPAIRHGRRRSWLVPAGLLAAVAVGLLVAALRRETLISVTGITALVLLYAAMLVAAVTVRPTRTRNLVLAWIMIVMGAVALGLMLVLMLAERAAA